MSSSYPKYLKMPNELPLPPDTVKAVNSRPIAVDRRNTRPASFCHAHSNLGLYFERYISFQQNWEMDKFETVTLRRNGKEKVDKSSCKQYILEELVEVSAQIDDSYRQSFTERWTRMVAPAKTWQMTPVWRFVTGVGNKTALEAGFTFHRVYGFPYIPGSSLKGLARAVALLEIAQKAGQKMVGLQEALAALQAKKPTPMQALEIALLEESKKYPNALRSWAGEEYGQVETLADQFRAVFGTQEQVGQAIFHDAVPAAKPKLEVDVMTVHYPDYYQKNKPPADTQNPTPIPFLTVGQTPFWFAVGWHGDSDQ
ncbi:MAG: type III-B CRISPR module RAMP protein Cmr6, partial [Chloroflexi bacterium]